MSVFAGPKISNNGLILHLDAANIRSYPGSGTSWFDISGNNRNATLINGTTFNSGNKGAMLLDGVNDYISVNTSGLAPSQLTIEVFFKTPTNYTGQSGYIIAMDNFDNPELRFSISAMKCRFDLFDDGAYIMTGEGTSTAFTTNTWVHMCATLTNGSQKGYQNGQEIHSGTGTYSGSSTTNLGEFSIGTYNRPGAGYGGYLNAYVSLVKIYNRVLTQEEILQNFIALRGRYDV
ncbi:MAG: LamG domain-containing protein [Proteobacteria bacterium]|nr:LamG domain-containing protein [Pseudomonadota bacterium]